MTLSTARPHMRRFATRRAILSAASVFAFATATIEAQSARANLDKAILEADIAGRTILVQDLTWSAETETAEKLTEAPNVDNHPYGHMHGPAAGGADSETITLLSGTYLIFAAGADPNDPIRVEITDEGFMWKVAEIVVNGSKPHRYGTAILRKPCLCRLNAKPASAKANGDYRMSIAIVQPIVRKQ